MDESRYELRYSPTVSGEHVLTGTLRARSSKDLEDVLQALQIFGKLMDEHNGPLMAQRLDAKAAQEVVMGSP